jgi:4-hydroxybenzoate polyprenyltransferase
MVTTFIAFFCFAFTASTVYILNDIIDVEKDRLHPEKSKRPIASGELKVQTAILSGFFLLVLSLITAYWINPIFTYILMFYLFINILYCIWLKNIVIVDVMIIALGFVLRGVAGAIVVHVSVTSWFILCTMLLALFLALSKRRHELELLKGDKHKQRKVRTLLICILGSAYFHCYSSHDHNIFVIHSYYRTKCIHDMDYSICYLWYLSLFIPHPYEAGGRKSGKGVA